MNCLISCEVKWKSVIRKLLQQFKRTLWISNLYSWNPLIKEVKLLSTAHPWVILRKSLKYSESSSVSPLIFLFSCKSCHTETQFIYLLIIPFLFTCSECKFHTLVKIQVEHQVWWEWTKRQVSNVSIKINVGLYWLKFNLVGLRSLSGLLLCF